MALIADELAFHMEERLADFKVTTDFFSRHSMTPLIQTVHFRLYGYDSSDADYLRSYLQQNLSEQCVFHMDPLVVHQTYFERVTMEAMAKRTNRTSSNPHDMRFVEILPELQI